MKHTSLDISFLLLLLCAFFMLSGVNAQNVDIHSSDISIQRDKLIHFADSLLGEDYLQAYPFCLNEAHSISIYDKPDFYCSILYRAGVAAYQLGKNTEFDSIMLVLTTFEIKNLHPLLEAKILGVKAKAALYRGLKIDALRFAKESISIYEQNKDFRSLIDANILLGNIYLSLDRNQLAMKYFDQAITFSDKLNTDLYLFRSYISSVEALWKISQMKEAQSRLTEVGRIVLRMDKPEFKAKYSYMLGKVFFSQANYQKSEVYFNQAIKDFSTANMQIMVSIVISWKAAIAVKIGRFEEAVTLNKQALKMRQNAHAISLQASSMYNIAGSLIKLKKYDSVFYFIEKGEELYGPFKNKPDYIRAYDLKRDVYLDRKDFKEAFAALEKSKQLRDSLFHIGNQRKLKELESDFSIGKFEQRKEQMETEADLQQIESDKNKLILDLLFITLVLVILASILFFLFVKNENKRKVILANQKLIFVQMNSHFVFNALTAIQSLIYKKQLESAIHYLTIFSSLINKVIAASQKKYINLQTEVSFVLEFLQIQKLRFGDDLKFQLNIADDLELEKIQLPPMLTYPFIEYAVEECVQKAGNHASLIIDVRKSGNLIHYDIIDKGLGFIDMRACFIKRYGGQEISCESLTKERISVYNHFFKSRITFAEKKVTLDGEEYNSLQFLIKN